MQCVLFFVAGYHTTASLLTFCSYELAMNPHVQVKLLQEINEVAGENGDIDYDTLVKMPYLDAVLSESLRKYPPILKLERTSASEKYSLGSTGIELTKGQLVEIPVYAIHYDEDNYPNPDHFEPERFLPENRHAIKPYTYLPFGAGPRNCVGLRFALLEAKLGLVRLIQKYKFNTCSKTDVPLKYKGIALLEVQNVILNVEKRHS